MADDRALILEHLRGHLPSIKTDLTDRADAATILLSEIRERGEPFVQRSILEMDELVHECMDETSGSESRAETSAHASRINNEGVAAQIACILAGHGADEGATLIREGVGLPLPSRNPGI